MGLRKKLFPLYYRLYKNRSVRDARERLILRIREAGRAKVLFIVSNLSMWRGQKLYEILSRDPRFEVCILLAPFASFALSQQAESMQALETFFRERDIPYYSATQLPRPGKFVRETLDPDIIFYPQQYRRLFRNGLDSERFDDKLLCFIPYALVVFDQGWLYNQRFNNLAWRLYFPSDIHLENARRRTVNKGANVRLVGDATADMYREASRRDVWKKQKSSKKRVIWAPHFSIGEKGLLHRGSFLVLHQAMVDLSRKYQDRIQFAFKPHPRLLSELYAHPDWGKERADAYYRQWAQMPSAQLETGAFADLFMGSDAMVHDCGSFTAEYFYTQNPVMFYTEDRPGVEKQLNELGLAALDAHYMGGSVAQLEQFLEKVVLGGEDPMKEKREEVYRRYLLHPNGRSAAENIYCDLCRSLGWEA